MKATQYTKVGKWINKCSTSTQWNKLSSHGKTQKKLKCIFLMKKDSLKVYTLYNSNYMTSGKGEIVATGKRSVVAKSLEDKEQEK